MTGARDDAYRAAAGALLARHSAPGLDDLAARATAALARVGIPSLLLRGPALARWLYDDPRERAYHDVDLLVAPRDHERAEQTLAAMGMRRRPGHGFATLQHATCFESPQGEVDLHWRVDGVRAPPSDSWAAFWRGRQRMEVGAGELAVPCAEARALIVALHACQHGKQRLVQLGDLQRAVRRLDVDTWRGAAALARDLDALAWFAAGLRYDPGGEALLAQLGIDEPVDLDVAVRAMGHVPLILAVADLCRTPGPGAKARLLARTAFPPPACMREASPLARRGWLGLLASYPGRWARLTARFVPAYRAYRRARRHVS